MHDNVRTRMSVLLRLAMYLLWMTHVLRRPVGLWLAKGIAPLIEGTIKTPAEHEKNWIRVAGRYRERSVQVSLGLDWGVSRVEIKTKDGRRIELYFRLDYDKQGETKYKRRLAERDEWSARSDPDDEAKHFFSEHVALTWSADPERLSALHVFENLPAPLRDELTRSAANTSRMEPFFAWDTLELKWEAVFWRLDPVADVRARLETAYRLIEAIEFACP